MKVDVYKAIHSKIESQVWHVLLKSGMDFDSLPEKIRDAADYFDYKRSFDLSPGEIRIALKTEEAISNIRSQGYYIQGTQFED